MVPWGHVAGRFCPGNNEVQTLNFDDLIERTRSGYFAAYHPVTRLKIGTYDSWFQAMAAINEVAK